jgi:hypothetical protein
MQTHWLLAKPPIALERLRLLLEVSEFYEESVGAMEVIGRQEKSVVDMEVNVCFANSLVIIQSQWRSGEVTAVVESQRVLGESVLAVVSH